MSDHNQKRVTSGIDMAFRIVRNDITKMNTEAIVNTANDRPTVGIGCDSAVYKAAGYDELLTYRKEKIGFVPEGEAFITSGYNLPAKYIIHAVSPLYIDGNNGEEDKLRSCYRKSLKLAKENGIHSIAFPLISTGGFGYPKEEGMRIAVDEINAFLLKEDMDIYLVVFDTKATELGEKIYPDLEAYIDHNYVQDNKEEEYGNVYFGSYMSDDRAYDLHKSSGIEPEERIRRKSIPKRSDVSNLAGMPSVNVLGAKISKKSSFLGSIFRNNASGSASNVQNVAEQMESDDFADEDVEESGGYKRGLEERLSHTSDTFSQYLMFLIESKGMENAEVYKRAIVDKKTFSKIKNNKDYHPQKQTALCLCIGAMLNLDESKDLLARAGYALSPCDKTDIIFSYYIENEIYDMIDLDIDLEEHGLSCIIA